MDTSKLKEYLKCLYELEESLYYQQKVYDEVYNEYRRAVCSYHEEEEIPHEKPVSENVKYVTTVFILVFMLIFAIIGCIYIKIPIGFLNTVVIILFYVVLGPLVGYPVGWMVKKIVEKIRMKKQMQQIMALNRSIDHRNEEIRASNANNKALAQRKGEAIKVRIKEIEQGIDHTRDILNRYYALDIIFKKYRNFVAISSIYEYFVSGRCEELGGPHGAYNVYEEEIRQNMIISKLDDVINSLSRIENNQSMLYDAIWKGNLALQQMQQAIQEMSSSIQNIENNSEITAYNSKITAENIRFMKKLQIYEMLTRK